MSDRFNAVGPNHRDCPVCFRVGTLAGERGAESELKCSQCCARFSYAPATATEPAMLTRLANFRPPLDEVCKRCGAKHCHCGFDTGRDPRADFPGYSR